MRNVSLLIAALIFLFVLFSNSSTAQGGSSCATSFALQSEGCNPIQLSGTGEKWFTFTANSSLSRLSVVFLNHEATPNPVLHPYSGNEYKLYVISGSCLSSANVIVDSAALKPGFHIDISGLTNGSTYFLVLDKPDTVRTWVSMCFLSPIVASQPSSSCELVCNGDFEDSTGCVNFVAQMEFTQCWDKYLDPNLGPPPFDIYTCFTNGSPDYFNANYGTCSLPSNSWPLSFDVPSNGYNTSSVFSYPAGNTYVGIFTYKDRFYPTGNAYSTVNDREYLQQKLGFPLQPNRTYSISFYYRRSDISSHSTRMGVLFSNDSISQNSGDVYQNQVPQLVTSNVLTVDTGWVPVQFNYTTTNGYTWVAIGNFENDQTNVQNTSPGRIFVRPSWNSPPVAIDSSRIAYYFIDHVSIKPVDTLDVAPDTTLCLGESYTLFANLEGNFGDSIEWIAIPADTSLTGNENDSIVTVTPLDTTQYIVTVWDIYGCVYKDTITVNVVPNPFKPVISGPIAACDSTNLAFVYTIPSYPNETYTWSAFGPFGQISGTDTTTASTLLPYYSSGGFIVFFAKDTVTGCVSLDTLIIHPCCKSSAIKNGTDCVLPFPPFQIIDLHAGSLWSDNSATLIALYGNNTISGRNIVLNGVFTVNSPYLEFNAGCHFYMGPYAKIAVLPGCTLKIKEAIIEDGCCKMWDGIYESDPSSLVIFDDVHVEDGLNVIVSTNCAPYQIFFTRFNRNFIDVMVKDCAGTPHTGTISTSRFLSQPFVPTNEASQTLHNPHTGRRAYIGVYTSDIFSQLTVGVTTALINRNFFTNHDFGIYSERSNLYVYNNSFVDLAQFNNVWFSGIGIFATADKPTPGFLRAGGPNANERNYFRNTWVGMQTFNFVSLIAENDSMVNTNLVQYGLIGIGSASPNSQSVIIKNNVLRNHRNSIWCSDSPNSLVEIRKNKINPAPNNLYRSNFGIRVDNALVFPMTLHIAENEVSRARFGINVINATTDFNGNQPLINYNKVGFNFALYNNLPKPLFVGIEAFNSPEVIIDTNWVNLVMGFPGAGVDPTAAEDSVLMGIYVEDCNNARITNNIVTKVGSGIIFNSQCPSSQITCNLVTNCYKGFNFGVYVPDANIGDQYGVSANDNRFAFTTIGPHNFSNDLFGDLSVPTSWYRRTTSGWFVPLNVSTSNLTQFTENFLSGCSLVTSPLAPQQRESSWGSIVRNELSYPNLDPENKWKSRYQSYRFFRMNPSNLILNSPDDSIFTGFYNSPQVSVFNSFESVIEQTTLGNINTSVSLNNSVSPTNQIEIYRKEVNDIYLRTWAIGERSFSSADSSFLFTIASGDPTLWGDAVYSARVMVGYEPFANYSFREFADYSENIYVSQLSIVPNPTSGRFSVVVPGNISNGVLEIFDNKGKRVYQRMIQQDFEEVQVEIDLLSGIYLVRVSDDLNSFTGKLNFTR